MMPLRARLAGQLIRTQGPGWLAFRIGHALQLRSGLIRRRLPVTSWDDQPLSGWLGDPDLARPEAFLAHRRGDAPPFFFCPADRTTVAARLRAWDEGRQGPVARADELGQGIVRYFAGIPVATGFPPAWHSNPFTGVEAPAGRHWSRIGDFGQGDIKVIWEPSRFAFAYNLVRAFWRTGNEAYAERFWQLVESWRLKNPPQRGPNWKCGQEASLRVMAWCFGLYGFLEARATTAARATALAQMIAVSGRRIEATLGYALSQRNNHGISEGMGLWTIGALFPELRASARWRERGRRVLEEQARALIYDDGAFSQHSVNYHRLMLHAFAWSLRLGDVLGQPFSAGLRDRVATAAGFLHQLQDEASGRVPSYGQNDGALILPLNNCSALDFRPVVQAARYLTTGTRTYPDGPWDEDLLWLCGAEAAEAAVVEPRRTDLRAEAGGYYTLRSPAGFAFIRCASFRHRPSQADMLHLDLWWRGQNLALDAGTYSYHAPPPWDNALARTAYHNTVTVDDRDQMEQAGKFLWLPWLHGRSRLHRSSTAGHLAYWEGEHDGYARLDHPVIHRRGIVRLGAEHWLVLDALRSPGPHRYRLHWLLPDLPHDTDIATADERVAGSIRLETPAGPFLIQLGDLNGPSHYSLVRADADSPRGWMSPGYMSRAAALSLAVSSRSASAEFWTLFGPPGTRIMVGDAELRVESPAWVAGLGLGRDATRPLLIRAAVSGAMHDVLEVAE
jgi:asparagine synthase (glutamine-hydrolysing)